MREIKFRAWDGERLRKVNTIGWVDDGVDFVTTPRYSGPAEDFMLMQYAGLKDKNGVEIYDGDVLKHMDRLINSETINPVYWKSGALVFDVKIGNLTYTVPILDLYQENKEGYPYVVEVLGNIYENPELLEREVE